LSRIAANVLTRYFLFPAATSAILLPLRRVTPVTIGVNGGLSQARLMSAVGRFTDRYGPLMVVINSYRYTSR
jgi:hypothetical protein